MKKRLNLLLQNNYVLDTYVTNNFKNLRLSFLFFPFLVLLTIVFFLLIEDAFSVEGYVNIQKDLFLYLNAELSKFPNLEHNLTQFGDVLIFLPFLTIFMVYAPKFWESLITSLLVCGIVSKLLKNLFDVPRPAQIFDHDSFVIIGKTLVGYSSLPSGHSIATFTIIISVFFAFMPKNVKFKILWFFFIFISGAIIVLTRVGVGAHHPIDVVIGSTIGYICALTGIFINNRLNLWTWLTNKKYYPLSILLFSIWAIVLITKIVAINLIIFYFSLVCLIATLFIITYIYVKK